MHDAEDGVLIGLPRSCADNTAVDGPTTLYNQYDVIDARCDLHSPNGPWLTFQRRVDTTDFDRNWKAYKEGFGDRSKSFWLGNDNLHELTKNGADLRVDLCTLPEGVELSEELVQNPTIESGSGWEQNPCITRHSDGNQLSFDASSCQKTDLSTHQPVRASSITENNTAVGPERAVDGIGKPIVLGQVFSLRGAVAQKEWFGVQLKSVADSLCYTDHPRWLHG